MASGSVTNAMKGLAADARSLDALKLQAGQNSAGAIKDAAPSSSSRCSCAS